MVAMKILLDGVIKTKKEKETWYGADKLFTDDMLSKYMFTQIIGKKGSGKGVLLFHNLITKFINPEFKQLTHIHIFSSTLEYDKTFLAWKDKIEKKGYAIFYHNDNYGKDYFASVLQNIKKHVDEVTESSSEKEEKKIDKLQAAMIAR